MNSTSDKAAIETPTTGQGFRNNYRPARPIWWLKTKTIIGRYEPTAS